MNPNDIIAQGRSMLITELNIMHLTPEEQDEILEGLGEVLLRRVLLKMFDLLPENERDNFGKLLADQKGDEAQAIVQKYIPNSADIIKAELRAGVDEHKRLVTEAVAKDPSLAVK